MTRWPAPGRRRRPPGAKRLKAKHLPREPVGPALVALAAQLLAAAFAGQGLLGPALVAGLQVEAVLLDVLDDVFLLNLALEAAEGVLDRLAFLNLDLSHT